MASRRRLLRNNGDRSERPHRLFPAVSPNPRRIRVGSRRHRRSLLVRVSGLGRRDPVRWLVDRPARPKTRHRNRRLFDGNRARSSDPDPAALATLPHPRRAGRRRREPSRLYGPITIPHQLVCTAARARAEHCVLGGRCRFDHHFALAANLDRQFGLANCLLVSRAPARRCLAPLNLLLKRRPADLGLEPDGISGSSTPLGARSGTDSSLPSDDWTLGRAVRTPRFRWLATSYFCGLFTWYA